MNMRFISVGLAWALLVLFAVVLQPAPSPGRIPGPLPDSHDYAYGAEAVLYGSYTVTWQGASVTADGRAHSYDGTPRIPQYPPGMALLLGPFVALGGVGSAVWLSYLAALALGALLAFIAFQLDRPLAAPLALLFGLWTPAVISHSRIVMSDLPAAALVLAVAALLLAGSRYAAGLLLGFLPLLRIGTLPLSLALLASLRRPRMLLAAAPILALNVVWHWSIKGSPLSSGYTDSRSLSEMFSVQYIFGPPLATDGAGLSGAAILWDLPNALAYPLQLAGLDGFLGWPFVGLVGLAYLVRCRLLPFARFALAVLVVSYITYTPYFYQGARFLIPAATLLNLSAALAVADVLAAVARRGKAHHESTTL